jgi:Tfp pilus assembly protein PilX
VLRPVINSHQQRGTVLVVGLIMMMVLTILAISTMRTSTLEVVMAANTQYRETAFQLSQAGLRDTLERVRNGTLAPGLGFNGNMGAADQYIVTTTLVLPGALPPAGFPQDGTVLADYYEIRSTGLTTARNARSVQVQGFWINTSVPGPIATPTYWFEEESV